MSRSYGSYGSGEWYAWFRGADGSYQENHFATQTEAEAWAERWRKTAAPGDKIGVAHGKPHDLRSFAALNDGA